MVMSTPGAAPSLTCLQDWAGAARPGAARVGTPPPTPRWVVPGGAEQPVPREPAGAPVPSLTDSTTTKCWTGTGPITVLPSPWSQKPRMRLGETSSRISRNRAILSGALISKAQSRQSLSRIAHPGSWALGCLPRARAAPAVGIALLGETSWHGLRRTSWRR